MAAVAIEISGVLYNKVKRTTEPVLIRGMASIIGLEVGGGPIIPPSPGDPPGIWGGPIDPYPDHGLPQPRPPGDGIWGPNDPRPTPPIANVPGLPPTTDPPPEGPADDNGFIKPPPPQGGWAYHEQYSWGYYPAPGQAGPK